MYVCLYLVFHLFPGEHRGGGRERQRARLPAAPPHPQHPGERPQGKRLQNLRSFFDTSCVFFVAIKPKRKQESKQVQYVLEVVNNLI